jgi:hypothetical protein
MEFTVLIPAYKPKYLGDLLVSLAHQTKRPAAIIFSDDSPEQSFSTLLMTKPLRSRVLDLNIKVIPGTRNGAYNNFRNLLQFFINQKESQTELFQLLLDDDVIYPTFYERHLFVHKSLNASCVISRRWTALENGQPFRDPLPLPSVISEHSNRILSLDSDVLFKHTVGERKNWLGEFSNATFRADIAPELIESAMLGINYAGLEDLGGFLKASLHGPVGFINEHLGFFRTSDEQHSANPMGRPLKLAFLAYISLTFIGRNLGKLSNEQVLISLQQICPFILHHYGKEMDMFEICKILPRLAEGSSEAEVEFLRLWDRFIGTPQVIQPL